MSNELSRPTGTDDELMNLWLHGFSEHTRVSYKRNVLAFLAFTGRPLKECTLADAQAFAMELEKKDLSAGSKRAMMAPVKSIYTFGARIGWLDYNVTGPLKLPATRETLSDRILDEDEVMDLIQGETNPRNRAILHLLYATGIRREELAGLRWKDCRQRGAGGQITVFGKGNKTRSIKFSAGVWNELIALRGSAGPDAPVFLSRRGGPLDESQIYRIVVAAAKRAGLGKNVSPHWLRHCHCSHALEHGSPIHLVQQTAGHSSLNTTSRYLHARPSASSADFIPEISPGAQNKDPPV